MTEIVLAHDQKYVPGHYFFGRTERLAKTHPSLMAVGMTMLCNGMPRLGHEIHVHNLTLLFNLKFCVAFMF